MKQFSFKKIKEIREELGWTKTELARRTGLTAQQIWNWENSDPDEKSLTVDNLSKIANAMKVTTDAFFVEP
jgi:transcriptional regulator with XRE-family HTH domain